MNVELTRPEALRNDIRGRTEAGGGRPARVWRRSHTAGARTAGEQGGRGIKVVNLSGLPVLDANDQRIVGALLEKQMTVRLSCPLTAIALRATSHNRDPVLDLDLPTVEQVAR